MTFDAFNLPKSLLMSLEALDFKTPTPIQEQAIPIAMQGQDILGSAQTGTGKTGAFGIPLIAKLLSDSSAQGLIITPTRELATQVHKNMMAFLGKKSPIKTALLIGGDSIGKQCQSLRRGPRLFVGTPGRLSDHIKRGSLSLKKVTYLVLDETDRMLDMGFSIQIDEIVKHLPQERQTLLFSATLPKNILKMSENYMKNPVRISVGSVTNPAENIDQEVTHLAEQDKFTTLSEQLKVREGSIIVFVKTKFGAERMAKRLASENHHTDALHGDLKHNKRENVIRAFRAKKFRVLIATDVAARGLDIPHIEHVINFDLPQCPEDYIHRIGRTARAGAKGQALCFVSPSERGKWFAIQRLLDPNFKPPPRDKSQKTFSRKKAPGKRFSSDRKKGGFSDRKGPSSDRKSFAGKKSFSPDRQEGVSSDRKRPSSDRKSFTGKKSFSPDRKKSTFSERRGSSANKKATFKSDRAPKKPTLSLKKKPQARRPSAA